MMSSESDRDALNDSSTNNEEKLSIAEQAEDAADDGITKDISDEPDIAKTEEEEAGSDHGNEETPSDGLMETETDEDDEADPSPALLEQPVILQGKRSRKPTARLDISHSTPSKKEFSIPQGRGKPLGEIEHVNYRIGRASSDALSRLHQNCFSRRGVKTSIKKNLREFKGFEFERESDEYRKHVSHLTKLKKEQLRSMSNTLCLPCTGRNADLAERILNFLIEPVDDGRRKSAKKTPKRASKKVRTVSKGSAHADGEVTEQKASKNEDDYVYRPGKSPSTKRSASQSQKQHKRSNSAVSETHGEKKENEQTSTPPDVPDQKDHHEEIITSEETDQPHNGGTLMEKTDQNEVTMETSISDVV